MSSDSKNHFIFNGKNFFNRDRPQIYDEKLIFMIKYNQIRLLLYFVLIVTIKSIEINNSIILEFKSTRTQPVLNSSFEYPPSYIYLNSKKINFNNYIITISSINDKITLIWNYKFNNINKMFYGCQNILKIDFSHFNSETLYNMMYTFYKCISLENINFDNFITKNVNSTAYLFYECISLESIDLTSFDTSNVISMKNMFYNCSKLNKIIFSEFKNSLTTNMYGIFYHCSNLKSLNLSKFYTPKAQIMWNMFNGASSLTSLDLSTFDTSQVTDMESMFDDCQSLISLDISNFRTSRVEYMNKMFRNCIKLEYLDFRNINTNSIGYMGQMFYRCQSLKYLNLYSLNNECSTSEMFYGAASNFIYCINSFSNIPRIESFLNEKSAKNICSHICFNNKPYAHGIKACCEKYVYNSNCVSSCPTGTYLSNSICEELVCQNYYSYNKDECIDFIPEGYFLNSTSLKTIDKCHPDCKTCERLNTATNSYCTSCKNSKNFYLGNCYSECPKGSYYDDEYLMTKCKCFEEKCFKCSEESLNKSLCISCNEGYYPKYEDPDNLSRFINCYKNIEGYYLENNSIFKKCYESCRTCDKSGDDNNHNCLTCKEGYYMQNKNGNYINCFKNCNYYYYIENKINLICLNENKCPEKYDKFISQKSNVLKIAIMTKFININLNLNVIKIALTILKIRQREIIFAK